MYTPTRRATESAWLWLGKILSGVLILVVLVVHFVVNHLIAEGGLMNYDAVIAYVSNPWIVAMETFFLAVVVPHALLGTRSIILDLNPSRGLLNWLDRAFVLVGVVAVVYGIWLMQTIAARGG
jgi:succinate dehydrogenase / fumarate reductase membrane anchor subunit